MFSEYVASCSNVKISESVVDDSYERARGHAGLISLCGKAIDEHVVKGRAVDLTLASWLRLYHQHISRWLSNFSTMDRLMKDINGSDALKRILLHFVMSPSPTRTILFCRICCLLAFWLKMAVLWLFRR